jgi:hypothetical protein
MIPKFVLDPAPSDRKPPYPEMSAVWSLTEPLVIEPPAYRATP